MKENIFDIANAIQTHRNLEITSGTTNWAVGRVKTSYDIHDHHFWIINQEGRVSVNKDFLGNIIPNTANVKNAPYTKNGFTIPKNSLLGGILLSELGVDYQYALPSQEMKIVKIHNRAVYDPTLETLAENILINLQESSQNHSYRLISDILDLQKEIKKEEKNLQEAVDRDVDEEVLRLTLELELKRSQLNEKLAKAKNFIRKHAELRYQPILDSKQEQIKRSKIFNGKLIINGGPGTGKTTSLIQRIKFLTSISIEEYFPKLNKTQKEILFDQKKSWIFFSPNELLSLFLKNSMSQEELNASSETVKVWNDYKTTLLRLYKLTNPETQKPFRVYQKSSDKVMIPNHANHLKQFNKNFEDFFIKLQNQKLDRIKELKINHFEWFSIGKEIEDYISKSANNKINDFFRLYINLEENFQEKSKEISSEYNLLINMATSRELIKIKNDEEVYEKLKQLLQSLTFNNEDDEDEDLEKENFEESEDVNQVDVDLKLSSVIKSLIRKQALQKFDSSVKFTKIDQDYLKLILNKAEIKDSEKIGQLAYFKKYYERLTKGIETNIYREISSTYKKFRRKEFTDKSKLWNQEILDLIIKDKNDRLHVDEQAFIINFINDLNRVLAKNFRKAYQDNIHQFVVAYKDNCKAVIGIDEATDFRLIDLLCMSSFNHPDFDSVTLSGDMMQKLNSDGIKSWNEYLTFFKDSEIQNLEVSYRQSQTLLNLAQKIYEKVNDETAVYKSFISESENEPKPLLKISEDEDDKIEWIAKRIREIFSAYSFIPSIAIFLPNESDLENFAKKLSKTDEFDSGISVRACRGGEVLGDPNTVRVFSIDKIKGLEFEAAFFHNADDILTNGFQDEHFYKNMYVGLSRSSFYLAMTVNHLPEKLKFLNSSFEQNTTW